MKLLALIFGFQSLTAVPLTPRARRHAIRRSMLKSQMANALPETR